MLAACKAQPSAAPGNAVSQSAATKPTETSSPGDQALGKELAGDWVTSEVRPTGSAEDNCATDAGITLDADGSYGSLDEAGAWAVKNRTLIIAVTSSFDDSEPTNSDGAKEVPINPPRVTKWPIVKIEGNIALMRFEGGQFWMFRCPPPAKG
jgi:hypothetical protein